MKSLNELSLSLVCISLLALSGCAQTQSAATSTSATTDRPLHELNELCGEDPVCVAVSKPKAVACVAADDKRSWRLATPQESSERSDAGKDALLCIPGK